MRKHIATAFLALSLSGCGGTVIGSIPLDSNNVAGTQTGLLGDGRRAGTTLPTYGLPVAYYTLTVKRELKGGDCSLTVTLGDKAIYVRDPKLNFALAYHHDAFTTDSLAVQTDGQGLLMAINGQSENSTLAAIGQAFSLAADTLKLSFVTLVDIKGAPAGKSCDAFSGTFVFDPLSDRLGAELQGSQISILGAAALDPVNTDPVLDDRCAKPSNGKESPCVYFRLSRFYKLRIHDAYENATREITFTAPDQEHLYAIPMVRKDFVKFNDKLTFDHGVLTKYETDNPSEALAIIQIPSTIVKGIIGLEPSKK